MVKSAIMLAMAGAALAGADQYPTEAVMSPLEAAVLPSRASVDGSDTTTVGTWNEDKPLGIGSAMDLDKDMKGSNSTKAHEDSGGRQVNAGEGEEVAVLNLGKRSAGGYTTAGAGEVPTALEQSSPKHRSLDVFRKCELFGEHWECKPYYPCKPKYQACDLQDGNYVCKPWKPACPINKEF